jgi:hypothetical protein
MRGRRLDAERRDQAGDRFNSRLGYPYRFFVINGGLISYGPSTIDPYRRAASYVVPAHATVPKSQAGSGASDATFSSETDADLEDQ